MSRLFKWTGILTRITTSWIEPTLRGTWRLGPFREYPSFSPTIRVIKTTTIDESASTRKDAL